MKRILVSCSFSSDRMAISIYDKFILSTLLSHLSVLIISFAALIFEQVEKQAKILFINSLHKPPELFNFGSISRDHPVTVEPFQFSPS